MQQNGFLLEEDFQKTLDLLTELKDYIYEAEADPFRYFYRGQVFGDDWAKDKGNSLLYDESATDMLLTQACDCDGLIIDPILDSFIEIICNRLVENCVICYFTNTIFTYIYFFKHL